MNRILKPRYMIILAGIIFGVLATLATNWGNPANMGICVACFLRDVAGVNVRALATPSEVKTATRNVAGVNVPVFEEVTFPKAAYSLFGTPPWIDRALADLRELNRRQAHLETLETRYALIDRELTRVIQRVNLFEKVKIPACQEAIRIIRIALGDEMTAAVVRAKIAKVKLDATEKAGAEALAAKEHAA